MPRRVLSGLLWLVCGIALLGHATRVLAGGAADVAEARDFTSDRPFEACLEEGDALAAGSASLDIASRGRDGGTSKSRARLTWSSADAGSGPEVRVRLEMLAPAEIAGSALLLVERSGEPAEVWAWLPEIQKVRRVGGRHLNQPLFGTNLRYVDLERMRRLVDAAGPDAWSEADFEGRPVWKLLTRDGRDTVVTWLDRERCVPLRTEVSDERGRLSRWVEVSQQPVQATRAEPGAFVPSFLVVHDVPGETETRIDVTSLDLSSPPVRASFDPARLGRPASRESSPGS